jgi:hypothetical protein
LLPPGEERQHPCLFGLAPCGVYPAATITGRAVRSYRTFSPLPQAAYGFAEANHQPEAVCSLLHLPSRGLNASVPDVIRHTALRSSDFPPPLNALRPKRQRSSSRLHFQVYIALARFKRSTSSVNLLPNFHLENSLTPMSALSNRARLWLALWTPYYRNQAFEGTLVVRLGWRDPIGDSAAGSTFGIPQLGSLWSNYEFTTWDAKLKVEDLFWEQWMTRRLRLRIGNQIPTAVYNFSRFKDARVSFTASLFAFHDTIPYPTFGLGMSARWLPIKGSELYVDGVLNDMNGDPNGQGLDWATFGRKQYLLLTPNMTVTSGIQFIFNPSFNPTVDHMTVPSIKFRVVF